MDLLVQIALRYLNLPYIWGGKNPLVGVDCSGYVSLILNSMDAEHPGGILCSQGLYDFYSKPGNHISNDPQIGALVFYGASKTQINHVAICVSKKKMAEAAHGDRTLIMPEDAIRKGAYTKISPIRFDFHLQGIFMPHYPEYQNP